MFDVYTKEAAIFDTPSDSRKEKLDKKQLVTRLQEDYGDELIEMKIEGCASLFSLRSHLVEKLKPEESEGCATPFFLYGAILLKS